MVYYYTSEHEGVKYTLYMGRDKVENEELIRYGWPTDVWFHVDNLSSAHVYLRLPEGVDIKQIPAPVLADCAQLVKANSIQGNKIGGVVRAGAASSSSSGKAAGKVRIVYTPWSNLHKTKGMADGAVGFHSEKKCLYTEVVARENAIINRLEKTRVEKPTAYIKESRDAYEASVRAREKEAKRAAAAQAKADKERFAKEKEARSYDSLFNPDDMVSNAELANADFDPEEDFM